MAATYWDKQFFASTRGHIVALLRRADRTVDELAQALELTDNAVRAHLATLERDGLAQQQGVRRGERKPAYAYRLTPEAERLFPKPYAPVLDHLLQVLDKRMAPEEVEALLRGVGHELAAGLQAAEGDVRVRLEAAVAVLNELGGLAELEAHAGTYVIRGYSCPLAAVVRGHPEVCRLAETLVTEVAGGRSQNTATVASGCGAPSSRQRRSPPTCAPAQPRGGAAAAGVADTANPGNPRMGEPGGRGPCTRGVSSTYTESFEAGADTGSMREPSHVLFALMRLPDRRLSRSRLEIFAHVPYGSLPLSNGVVVGKSAHGSAGTPRVKADRKRCA